MSNNHYNLYSEKVVELAESILLKSDYTALKINEYIASKYGADTFDEFDKTTWKYYRNVSGEYHMTDRVMTITSLDTLQTILLSKDNLNIHTATAYAYKNDRRYVRELLVEYPEHAMLIQGILYPCDINKAIEAPDFSILSYATHLVESNEYSLMTKINEWLAKLVIRWRNHPYTLNNDMYGASMISIVSLMLIPLIFNLRQRACHTNEAHSFHVREFLASHGALDRYIDFLTQKQAMFLYRNIPFIELNAGHSDTFEWLIDRILTDRGIPLSEYTMKHDVSTMPTPMDPTVSFRKRSLNEVSSLMDSAVSYSTLQSILLKEDELADGNPIERQFRFQKIQDTFETSKSSTVITKVLESSMINMTDTVPYTQYIIALNEWMHMACTDRYHAYVHINDPLTGDTISLHARDAFYYYLYAYCQLCGVEILIVPELLSKRTVRIPAPTIAEIMGIVSDENVTEDFVQTIADMMPAVPTIYAITDFTQYAKDLYKTANSQYYLASQFEGALARAQAQSVISRFYSDTVLITTLTGQTYETWLETNNIPFRDYNEYDWRTIYVSLFEAATGFPIETAEAGNDIQRAMIAIMKQLSSYSVQYIVHASESSVKSLNWTMTRLDDYTSYGSHYTDVETGKMQIKNLDVFSRMHEEISLPMDIGNLVTESDPMFGEIELAEVFVKKNLEFVSNDNMMIIPGPVFYTGYSCADNSMEDYKDLGLFAPMTQDEIDEHVKVWCNGCIRDIVYPTEADLDDLLITDRINGFTYITYYDDLLPIFYYDPNIDKWIIANNDFIELDGFWPNVPDVVLNKFSYAGGTTHAGQFNYVDESMIGLSPISKQFNFTGGDQYMNVFELGDGFKFELKGFKACAHVSQLDFTAAPLGSTFSFKALPDMEIDVSGGLDAFLAELTFSPKYMFDFESVAFKKSLGERHLDFIPISAIVQMKTDYFDQRMDLYFTHVPTQNFTFKGLKGLMSYMIQSGFTPMRYDYEIEQFTPFGYNQESFGYKALPRVDMKGLEPTYNVLNETYTLPPLSSKYFVTSSLNAFYSTINSDLTLKSLPSVIELGDLEI